MHTWKVMVASVVIGSAGAVAVAQDAPATKQPPARERGAQPAGGDRPAGQPGEGRGGMRGAQLSPEKAKAAWELESKGVAKRLGLNDDQTKALVKAYADARTAHAEAMRTEMEKARDAGDPGAAREKMQELNKTHREKFEKSLAGTVGAEKAGKASASLGTFNMQWDRMVDTIAGFNLEAGKQQDALNAVEDFAVASGKARADAAGDREAMQSAMRDARDKLHASLKKVLTDEQFEKFQASMGPGGRGQGQGGAGGDQPRRRRPGQGEGEGGEKKPDKPAGGGGGGGGR